jgi:hypothetical protein
MKELAMNRGSRSFAGLCPVGTVIQSLILDKRAFSALEGLRWAKTHGFEHSKIDEKAKTFRLRQAPPSRFTGFRTITLKPGVKAVIGCPVRTAARLRIAADPARRRGKSRRDPRGMQVFVEEMTAILKHHGYTSPMLKARKLAAEGMGPEELEHRLRSTRKGAMGSLEYTHGFKAPKRKPSARFRSRIARDPESMQITRRDPNPKKDYLLLFVDGTHSHPFKTALTAINMARRISKLVKETVWVARRDGYNTRGIGEARGGKFFAE